MSDHYLPAEPARRYGGTGGCRISTAGRGCQAEGPPPLALRCQPDILALQRGKGCYTDLVARRQATSFQAWRSPEITLTNDLPVPLVLNWRGVDGVAAAEPLLGEPSLGPSSSDAFYLPLGHAGTYLCDPALLGDGAARPFGRLAADCRENEPVKVDRDEVLLIEGWRLKPDGSAIAPGLDPDGTVPVYTVNGALTHDIKVRGRERLRLRFINALQRHVIALKIEHHDVTIMALDGQPAEPFLARGGALALAPGGRADVFVDVPPEPRQLADPDA